MTYIVMETYRSYCVVVDEAGRFIKAANLNYEVGQTVERITAMKPSKTFNTKRAVTAVCSIAACLIMVLSVFLYSSMLSPFASVYLSINPSVRLDVSRDGRVVGLEPMNTDGEALLQGYDSRRKALAEVSDELVHRAIDMGFLSAGGKVTIDIDSPDEVWFQDTGIALRQNLNDAIDESLTVTIEIKRYDVTEAAGQSTPDAPQPPTDDDSIDTVYDNESGDDSDYAYSSSYDDISNDDEKPLPVISSPSSVSPRPPESTTPPPVIAPPSRTDDDDDFEDYYDNDHDDYDNNNNDDEDHDDNRNRDREDEESEDDD